MPIAGVSATAEHTHARPIIHAPLPPTGTGAFVDVATNVADLQALWFPTVASPLPSGKMSPAEVRGDAAWVGLALGMVTLTLSLSPSPQLSSGMNSNPRSRSRIQLPLTAQSTPASGRCVCVPLCACWPQRPLPLPCRALRSLGQLLRLNECTSGP